jgi:3-oxoacyl-[acyl-carrier-protein] synthase-3
VRVLLHSIAFGNLKPLLPGPARGAVLEDEDFARTIHAMGTSLVGWSRDLLERRLFAADARVFGLTSEGNTVAWRGYAAVAAAKVALESVSRAMAVEFAPFGVRTNVIQAGVTDTPALRAIPGHEGLSVRRGARAKPLRPPHHPARRRQRHLSALARRRRLDQRRADSGGRRRAHLGGHLVTLFLHGLGHFHPENEVTNAFLEGLDIGTTETWIEERVGIQSRRTTLPLDYIRTTRNRDPREAQEATLYTHAEAGRRAAAMALARAGIGPADVGMVIAGSSVMDTATPAEACNIARARHRGALARRQLGLHELLRQLHILSLMRVEALPPWSPARRVGGRHRVVDYTDRSSAVPSGATEASRGRRSRRRSPAGRASSPPRSRRAPDGADRVVAAQGHFRQDGRVVQMFAIRKTA